MEENQTNILADIVNEFQLTQASTGKRFANFLIDYAAFIAVFACFCLVWALIDSNSFGNVLDETNNSGALLFNVIILVFYVLYHSLMEFLTKGRSIGKFITGTTALTLDGNDISIGQALGRSLSRMVPFEPFSALGTPCYPWHDKWTHTCVIDNKKSSMLN